MSLDEKWMRRALELAEKGQGSVHPNPMVGAVLVRNGRLVGEGFHRRYGGDHEEVEAMKRAGEKAIGSTLYVNLEPCAHYGKTPPCTEAVARAGIRRVVAAMRDPNPRVSGKGFQFLEAKENRISVVIPVFSKLSSAQTEPRFHHRHDKAASLCDVESGDVARWSQRDDHRRVEMDYK